MDPAGRRHGARPRAFKSPVASAGAHIIHHARLASGLAFAGVLITLVSLGNQISTPLKPGDADVAQSRLAKVPLQTQEVKFAAPETGAWMRLSKAWGPPSYVLTVELARNEQGCWDDFHLDVKTPVRLEVLTEPLFGHVNACAGRPLGLKFQARSARFQITVPGHEPFPPADLAILPVWPGDMKQHVGEAYVDERLALASKWLVAVGGAVLALAGIAAMQHGWP